MLFWCLVTILTEQKTSQTFFKTFFDKSNYEITIHSWNTYLKAWFSSNGAKIQIIMIFDNLKFLAILQMFWCWLVRNVFRFCMQQNDEKLFLFFSYQHLFRINTSTIDYPPALVKKYLPWFDRARTTKLDGPHSESLY